MRAMKDSGVEWIGEIPVCWNVERMKNCINTRDGGAWGIEPQNNENDVICLRVADLDYPRLRFTTSNNLTIRNYTVLQIEKLQLRKGDMLIEKSGGGDKTPVGRAVIFDEEYKALFANFMERIRISKRANSKYFLYVLNSFYENRYVMNYIKQTTGIQNLDITSLFSLEKIPFPPLSEQTAIASYLDKKCSNIDAIITKNEQIIEKLKEYKSSLISETVTKALSPDVKMKYIATINPACKIPNISQDDNVTFVPMECVRNNKRLPKAAPLKKNNSSYSIFNDGDIALAKVTPCFQNGNLCIMENLLNGFAFGSSELFNIRPIRINTKFLLYFLMTKDFISGGIASMTGVAGLQRVSINYLRNVRLPYPPLTEQTAIAAYLDKKCSIIDANIARRELINAKLAEYKKSLIYEVVTGKKEV